MSAAVLAGGPLLALADRHYQTPADALLVACRANAHVGGNNPAKPTRNVCRPRPRRPRPARRRTLPTAQAGRFFAHPPQTPRREGTQSASQSPSLGDLWATLSWRAWLLSAWLAIIVWQVLRLLRQRAWLARLLRRAAAAEGELAQLVAELAESIGLRRPPTALCVAGHCPLFVCGLLRPRLVMPSGLMSSLGPAERRQVILHELAHLKRRDLLWGWTAEIAQVVYFFHPLVWWAGYRLRLERELACDQLAMARSGHPPADYAQTLVQVVSHASEPAGVQAAAISAELTGGQSPAKGD